MVNIPKNYDSGKSCFQCKHFQTGIDNTDITIDDFPNCIAFPFPDGIPDEIFENGHDKPRPDLGQKNEVVFEN